MIVWLKSFFIDNWKDIFEVILGVINIYFVILVYKINKKDSNPKLSFEVVKQKEIFTDKTDMSSFEHSKYFIQNLLFGHELKLLEWEIADTKAGSGFPKDSHSPTYIDLLIHNKADFPATNVKIDISYVIKKVIYETGIDEIDIIEESIEFIDYKTIQNSININYLSANSETCYPLAITTGCYISADIYINKVTSDELTFIKKPVKIYSYKHDALLRGFRDPTEYRKVFGAME
ncbi:hypothetical protein [Vagococcus silagei]|uniref:Uncharacterized protein n=1 Tax=Vagococcus silagei TaxID=2508885 RepID=A0A4S3B5T4_9ENTE|nr:hypothetical protein [Vagococcus silagei]THB61230.1 hypothetical protein ESZ54_05655 [Vagococcus silagei]